MGQHSRRNVAKVATGNSNYRRILKPGSPVLSQRMEIIHHLWQQAAHINGVGRSHIHQLSEGLVLEGILYQTLTVIKAAVNSYGMHIVAGTGNLVRSEERRVGKECRCRWLP